MLSPKKKLAKKEIKQDPMFALYDQSLSFYEKNRKYINYALIGLVVAIGLIFIYAKNKKDANELATTELGKVFGIYDAAANDSQQYTVAINGKPEKGIIGLKAIVEKYGSSESGEMARFYLANCYYRTGQFDEAFKQYDAFSAGTPLLKSSALAGMGGCYESKREFAKAAVRYEEAAGTIANSNSTPDYLRAAGRCYGLAGEKEKAVALFKRIKKEYPTSAAAREADRYISQFSA